MPDYLHCARTAWARLAVLAALFLAGPGGAGASADLLPEPLESRFSVTRWTAEDGLPEDTIVSMARTPDGYLWCATFNGLVRFDGVRFQVFTPANTPALHSGRIVALATDSTGILWVFLEDAHLVRLAGGRFEVADGRWGLPGEGISFQGIDPDGNVWVAFGNEPKLARSDAGEFVTSSHAPATQGDWMKNSKVTGIDTLWLRGNGVWQLALTHKTDYFPLLGAGGDLMMSPARDGDIWSLGNDRIRKIRARETIRLSSSVGLLKPTDFIEDTRGNFWLATWNQGLFFIERSGRLTRFPLTPGGNPEAESVRSLMQDSENNLWVATERKGLVRIQPRTFRTFNEREGMLNTLVKSVLEDRAGNIWAVNRAGIDVILPNGGVTNLWREPAVWCVAGSRDGRIFAGTFTAIAFQYQTGEFVRLKMTEPPGVGPVYALAFDGRDNLLAGGGNGLWRLDGSTLVPVRLPPNLGGSAVRAIADDLQGRIYVGLDGKGLLHGAEGKWEHYGKSNGLADDHIFSLLPGSNDVCWIGTAYGGLSRLKDGRIFNYNGEQLGLPSGISCIAADDLGYFWLGSSRGIYRVRRTELDALADGRARGLTVRSYSKADGMGSSECASSMQPTFCKSRDGRLWFATVDGVAVVNPAMIPTNAVAPSVVIEQVRVDDQVQNPALGMEGGSVANDPPTSLPREGCSFTLAAGSRRAEIRYTALSFTASDRIRFRYRLEPLDDEWTEAGGRRAVYYQDLSPGRYQFRVIACNNDGVWNETGASLALVVAPKYWQTWWFRAAFALVLGGMIFSGFRVRIAQLQRAHAAQAEFSRQLINAEEAERKRMAGELHDSLGQELMVIKNRAIIGLSHPNPPPGIAEQLQGIFDGATNAIEEVRATAFALRPYELDRLGLTRAAESMVRRVGEVSDIKFSLDLDEVQGLLSPEVEISLYRILQEAINNILKHSGAKSVIVELKREPPLLRLCLLDDGRGFDSATPEQREGSGGFGLKGMAQRCKLIGGDFQVLSASGKGTRLTVTVPLPAPKV